MLYLIQTVIYTGLMLLVYLLLLKDKPMHRFNRGYLLATIMLPPLLPLLSLPQELAPVTSFSLTTMLAPVTIGGVEPATKTLHNWWLIALLGVYALGAMLFLIATVYSYFKMRAVIKTAEKQSCNGYTVLHNTGFGPGSWGKYIFLPEGNVDETIIAHELAHIQLQHSKDLLFFSLMRSFLWPNLFLHFIKNELVLVHEFQADAAVKVEKETYAQLLLSSVFSTCALPLSHSFIVHPIKRRIMMLNSNKPVSKLRSVIAIAASLVIMLSVVTIQSCQTKEKAKPLDGAELTELSKMPEPDYNVYEFIGKEVQYPESAKAEGVEGKVAVKFLINEQGAVTDAKIISKEYDERLGEAALAAVLKMPDWQPAVKDGKNVAVWYTIPIKFALPKEDELSEVSDQVFHGKGLDMKKNYAVTASKVEGVNQEVSRQAKVAKRILDDYNK